MTATPTSTPALASTWSQWTEATDEQREYHATIEGHKAWSRICGDCGQGDYLERKQRPVGDGRSVQGRAFPVLPEPAVEEGKTRRAFRTPAGRVHVCHASRAR
jgi:hypothetical protein